MIMAIDLGWFKSPKVEWETERHTTTTQDLEVMGAENQPYPNIYF